MTTRSEAKPTPGEAEANAALIVRAVNCHEKLIGALEDAARECGIQASVASMNDDWHGTKAWAELQHRLDAALRTARGE